MKNVKRNYIKSTTPKKSNRLFESIQTAIAESYIEALGHEISEGMKDKARQGFYPGGPPLGYRSISLPTGKKGIAPDPTFAPLVRDIFDWYCHGISIREIFRMIDSTGLKLKGGNPITEGVIRGMLKRPLYAGFFYWDGVKYTGKHTPLISEDIYDKAQELMTQSSLGKKKKIKTDKR